MDAPVWSHSTSNFSQSLARWVDRRFLWASKHWLAIANTFFFLYAGLPVLAPILLANGYPSSANTIYWLYHLACHQLPSRAYFIAGEQVAQCHRCISIYATLCIGGLLFSFGRRSVKSLAPKWYIFFLVPMALDGGMGLVSELTPFVPMWALWVVGLVVIGAIGAILYSQKWLTWHSYLFLSLGPLALIYLQFFGPHTSNVYLRALTGFIFGVGTLWFAYPAMEQEFNFTQQQVGYKLAAEE